MRTTVDMHTLAPRAAAFPPVPPAPAGATFPRSGGLSAIVLSVLLASSAQVHAQASATADAAARTHFERGEKLSREGRFREAHDQFQAGYALSRRPLFLFNMGECARLSGDVTRARMYYERYLREDPQGKLAKQATERLAALPAAARPPAAPPAGPSPTRAPAPPPSATPSPPPTVSPPAPGLRLTITTPPPARGMEPAPPAPAQNAAPRPLWKRWPFWAGVAAVVVAASVTTAAVTSSGGRSTPGGTFVIDLRR
jgi:hypothetical protein